MTRKQRETVAKAVGSLWGVAVTESDGYIKNALNEIADELDRMLSEDIDTEYRCDACTITYDYESRVDET